MNGAVNYQLERFIDEAIASGVIENNATNPIMERRHITELEEKVMALDEKEVFIVTKTLVSHHWDTLAKALIYIKNQEGENQ